jgi:hypothetical protein
MTVAEVAIRGGLDLELRALQWLYGSWLPRSGFVPDDQPGFEAWVGLVFALSARVLATRMAASAVAGPADDESGAGRARHAGSAIAGNHAVHSEAFAIKSRKHWTAPNNLSRMPRNGHF